jgi:hypothetical protein
VLNHTDSPLYCQKYLDILEEIALPNKYTLTCLKICRRAAVRADTKAEARKFVSDHYIESHHIVPKSFGFKGSTHDRSNLVHVSAKEHYLIHLLLTRMFKEDSYRHGSMITAFDGMCNMQEPFRRLRGRKYQEIRVKAAQVMSERRKGMLTPNQAAARKAKIGKPMSKIQLAALRARSKNPTPKQRAYWDSIKDRPMSKRMKDSYIERIGRPRTNQQKKADEVRRGRPPSKEILAGWEKTRGKVRPKMYLSEMNPDISPKIDIQETIKKFGYDPRYLKSNSNKKVVRNCCGAISDSYFPAASGRCVICKIRSGGKPKRQILPST